MCRLHKISYACRHVDDILASCEFRFEGREDANGKLYPCEISTTELTDPSRLCLACSSLRGYDSAAKDLIDLNPTNTRRDAIDGPSSDGLSTMQTIIRNETYLRKRAKKVPFPSTTTISFAYPSASELQLQYCRNEELLARRLRRKTFQHHLDGELKEYGVYLKALRAHIVAKDVLEDSVLTLCGLSKPPNSISNDEQGTQTLDTSKVDASTQTEPLLEKITKSNGDSQQNTILIPLDGQANELDEMFDLQNSDAGSLLNCFPNATHEVTGRVEQLNQMFELQEPDISSLIDCFPDVHRARAGPYKPRHGRNNISGCKGKGKQVEYRSMFTENFGLDGSFEGLGSVLSEENVELLGGTDHKGETSDSCSDSDDERGISNPFLDLEELEVLYDDSSSSPKGTRSLQEDQDDHSQEWAPLHSRGVKSISDLRASFRLDTGKGKDKEDTKSSLDGSENQVKGTSKGDLEDSHGRSIVAHGKIALTSPTGLANLVQMREFLGMPYDTTPRQIYNFVNRCPQLLQHSRFGTVPLNSRHEGRNDVSEVSLLPDNIEKLAARNAFVQAWTFLHWNFGPQQASQETARTSRTDGDRETIIELGGDERSVWSSSSSDSGSCSDGDDDEDEETALSIKKTIAKIKVEKTFSGRLRPPAHKPKIASGLRECWTYYEEDELISAESAGGKVLLSRLRRLLCMPESTTARQISSFIDRNPALFRSIHQGLTPGKKSRGPPDPCNDPKSRIAAADTEANMQRWNELATALRRLDWEEIDAQPVKPSANITVEDITDSSEEEEDVPLTVAVAVPTRAEIQLARSSTLGAYRAKNPSRLRQSFTPQSHGNHGPRM